MGLEPVQGEQFWNLPAAFYSSLTDHFNIRVCKGVHFIIYYSFDGRALTSKWAQEIKLGASAVEQAGSKASEAADGSAPRARDAFILLSRHTYVFLFLGSLPSDW